MKICNLCLIGLLLVILPLIIKHSKLIYHFFNTMIPQFNLEIMN